MKILSNVCECLNRVFVNSRWLQSFPKVVLQNLPIMHYDHGHIIMDTRILLPIEKKVAKFKSFWSRDRACSSIVKKLWTFVDLGSVINNAMVQLAQKLHFS